MKEVKFITLPERKTVIAVGEKTRGKAVCFGDDEFDLEFGKQLAKKRMLLSRVKKDLRQNDRQADAIQAQINKLSAELEKLDTHAEFLWDKEECLASEIRLLIGVKYGKNCG